MKISELEDADQLVTKEWFRAELAGLRAEIRAELRELELRMTERLIASERGQRAWIAGLYTMVLGLYGMIVAAIYINHLWK